MHEISGILRRQTDEQRRLRELSWPDKVRMIERVRDDVLTLRRAQSVLGASDRKIAQREKARD